MSRSNSRKTECERRKTRTIKFRVIYKNQIFGYEILDENGWKNYSLELDTDKNGKILRYNSGVISDSWFQLCPQGGNLIRDQFTGMRDIDGREIYENDIVNKWVEFWEFGKNLSGTRIVVFKSGSFHLFQSRGGTPKSRTILFHKKIHAAQIKVVGNIFENPELFDSEGKVSGKV